MQPPSQPDEPVGDGDGDHAELATRLHASLSGPSLDAATRARHLDAIRARAATLPTPAPAPAPARARTVEGLVRRLASTVTAAGLVAVMGASGAVAAAHDTLPGQALYPVKHTTEQLVLAAPLPTGHAVDRHLTYAERRLSEAAALVERDADPTLVAEAIAAHRRLLASAGDLAGDEVELAARVDAAAAAAHRRLARLLDEGLPEVAAQQARAALDAAEARLDHRPAVPPPAPDRRPDTPAPTTTPERTSPPDPATPAPATPPQPAPAPAPRPAPGADPGAPQRPERQPGQPEATPSAPESDPRRSPPAAEQRADGEDVHTPHAAEAPTGGGRSDAPEEPPRGPAR